MSNLKEMVVVVTGGAQGIGREYARRLVADGARVVVADLNAEKGAAVAAELGDRAIFAAVDVSDEASCHAMAAAAVGTSGASTASSTTRPSSPRSR